MNVRAAAVPLAAATSPTLTGPDGSVLSCFTAAIAHVIWKQEGSWLCPLGDTVALRIQPAGELFAFSHHRRSLRSLLTVPIRRTGTDDPGAAIDDIEAGLRATGHVIVAGDAVNLPWSTAYRRRHAPHWFVVDGRSPAGGWHVTDPFCALDEHGEQHPWSGVISDAAFPAVLRAAALAPEQVLRERYAFGDCGPEPPGLTYQYFMPGDRTGPGPLAEMPDGGWLAGPAAVRRLSEHFAAAERLECYRQADDLWVAARHRELRYRALKSRLGERNPAVRAAAEAASAWSRVPATVRYAAESVRRGRRRVSPVLAALTEVERAESQAEAVAG